MSRFASPAMRRIKDSGLGSIWSLSSRLERAGREIIHFEIGRPDFDTPAPIKEAAVRAMEEGHVHYTEPRGIMPLRQAIADDMSARLGVSYDPETQVVVGTGGVEGIFNTLATVINPGDQVAVPEPLYPFYLGWAEFFGGETVPLPQKSPGDFSLDEEHLLANLGPKVKVLVINTPRNPTGTCYDLASLQAAAAVAIKRDLLVISDEVYDRIVFPPFTHVSIASLPGMAERTVVVNTFSKSFAMDGWRIGWMAGPADLLDEMDKVHLRVSTCAGSISQRAALQAMRMGDELVQPMVDRYRLRRDLIVDLIKEYPELSCRPPQGTFYLWLDYSSLGLEDQGLCEKLLETCGVAVTPGYAFGPNVKGKLRISFATSRQLIEKGVNKLAKGLMELAG